MTVERLRTRSIESASPLAGGARLERDIGARHDRGAGNDRGVGNGTRPSAAGLVLGSRSASNGTAFDVAEMVHGRAAVMQAVSQVETVAEGIGLRPLYHELVGAAAKRYGIPRAVLEGVRGHSYQVTKDTPIGFAHRAGDVVWPPNQSLGRHLGLYMARTILIRPVEGSAVLKIKGAGQAFDHPAQQTQRINDQPRPPLPFPLLWNRSFWRTGTPQFGLPEEEAKLEVEHLLTVHALSKRLFGELACAPIPLEVTRIEHVVMRGREMTLVRARGDRSLWSGREDYFERDQQDYFERLKVEAPERVRSASSLADFRTACASDPIADQRALLAEHGIAAQSHGDDEVKAIYPSMRLALEATSYYPLGQVTLIERGQFRNNIVAVWRDASIASSPGEAKAIVDGTLSELLGEWGVAYTPLAAPSHDYAERAAEPYRAVAEKRLYAQLKKVGRMYGMLRAFGAECTSGFHPKDMIGPEVTDWVDYHLPIAREKPLVPFNPLNDWVGYQGGVDQNIECLAQIFGIRRTVVDDLRRVWREEARSAARATAEAGLSGRLDDLLGGNADHWHRWIEGEIREAREGGDTIRDALGGLTVNRVTQRV